MMLIFLADIISHTTKQDKNNSQEKTRHGTMGSRQAKCKDTRQFWLARRHTWAKRANYARNEV